MEHHYALIDFDGLVFDTSSLWTAVSRSVTKQKLPSVSINSGESFTSFLSSHISEKDHETILQTIVSRVLEEAPLCRPHLGSIATLGYIQHVLNLQLIFLTANPSTAIGVLECYVDSLKPILKIPLSEQLSISSEILFDYKGTKNRHNELYYISLCPQNTKTNYFVDKIKNILTSGDHFLFIRSQYLFDGLLQLGLPSLTVPWIASDISGQQPLKALDKVNWEQLFSCNNNYFKNIQCTVPSKFQYPSKVQPLRSHGPPLCPERSFWTNYRFLSSITVFEGIVIKGFGRGGTQLGIPTANLDSYEPVIGPQLPFPGIYFGLATLQRPNSSLDTQNDCYDTILSVGYNPFYDNSTLTVEPYLFHDFGSERFDGAFIRLIIVGVLRAEANFDDFGRLIQAIQNDCEAATDILDTFQTHHYEKFQIYKQALGLLEGRERSGSIHDRA